MVHTRFRPFHTEGNKPKGVRTIAGEIKKEHDLNHSMFITDHGQNQTICSEWVQFRTQTGNFPRKGSETSGSIGEISR